MSEGTLVLVGGGEFTPPCVELDRRLVELAGHAVVAVLPTAAAFEHPERAVSTARAHFEALGASVEPVMALRRADAADPELVRQVRASRFTYLCGGSPMHLKSVLKDTPLWDALVASYREGGVLAASSAGAMVLTDPLVDPRGGAFTLGLALAAPLAVLPHWEQWSHDRVRRTLELAPRGVPLVGIPTGSAIVRAADGHWSAAGDAAVVVHENGGEVELSTLDRLVALSSEASRPVEA